MREMTRLQSNFVLEVRISYLGQTSGKNSPFLLIATRQPLEFNIEMLSYFMDMELFFFTSCGSDDRSHWRWWGRKTKWEEETKEEVAFLLHLLNQIALPLNGKGNLLGGGGGKTTTEVAQTDEIFSTSDSSFKSFEISLKKKTCN